MYKIKCKYLQTQRRNYNLFIYITSHVNLPNLAEQIFITMAECIIINERTHVYFGKVHIKSIYYDFGTD